MNERHFIDGDWVPPADGGRLEVIDPATEQPFAAVAAGDATDIDRAVAAARQAFRGPWRRFSGAERAGHLRAIAAAIRARLPELARTGVRDNGKPLPEAEWDLGDAAGCFDYYAGLAEALESRQGETIPLPDDRFRCTVRHEPVGPGSSRRKSCRTTHPQDDDQAPAHRTDLPDAARVQ